MHEHKTCEIPMLSSSNSSIWSSKKTMQFLQKNVVDSPKETRTPNHSDLSQNFEPSFFGRLSASPPGRAVSWCKSVEFSPSISSSSQSISRSPEFPRDFSRSSDLVGRWALVSLSKQALGFVSDRSQSLQRQNRDLPRPVAFPRQRRVLPMERSFLRHTSGTAYSNSCSRSRQSSRHEAHCQARRMGPSALSFSSAHQAPNSTRSQKDNPQGRARPRRYLSNDSSSSPYLRRIHTRNIACTIDSLDRDLLRHATYSGRRSRIYSIREVLPCLSHSSRIKSTGDDQHRRIHVLYHSRSIPTQSLRFQSSIAPAMGDSIDPITTKTSLQWKESSTDLINSSPNCDRISNAS